MSSEALSVVPRKRIPGAVFLCCVETYWGLTTVLMKFALDYMSSMTYIMLRFVIAGTLILLLFGRRLWLARSRRLFLHGFILGLLQVIPLECTVLALNYTSASNSIFIAQLSFVLVPLMECIYRMRLPIRLLALTALSLIIGLAIFASPTEILNFGNLICLISAVFNSLSILAVQKYVQFDSPLLLGAVQLVTSGLVGFLIWLPQRSGVLWCSQTIWILLLTSVVGSTGGYLIYIFGQARTEPITVSFLALLQPIFAMIGAAVFVDPQGHTEPIRWYMLVGTVIILAALSNYIRKTAVLESTSPT